MTSITSSPRPSRSSEPDRHRRRAPYVALLVVGTVLGLVGLVLASLAITAGWASVQQRDGQFLTTPTQRYSVTSYALTSNELILLAGDRVPGSQTPIAQIRLRATASDPSDAVFVGIGPRDQVASYLRDVEHTQLVGAGADPFQPRYRTVPGNRAPDDPGAQPVWAASAEGTGTQSIEVDVRSGHWSVVIMNADGSRGVSADLDVGIRTELLAPITVGLLVGTLVLLAGAVGLLVWGASGLQGGTAANVVATGTDSGPTGAGDHYPARLTGDLDASSRWLWLVKWLLLVPHLLVLAFLWLGLIGSTIVAWFAIVITGRYPRPLFDFAVGVLRWSWRVAYYGYSVLGTDRYPPFTLARTDYPADFDVDYPERLSRGLVLVKSWLLAIPHLIIVGLLTSPWYLVFQGVPTEDGRGSIGISLLGLLVLVAAVAMLFTGRYPGALFDLVLGINRWLYRVLTYVLLLRDEYPPFRLDQGPREVAPTMQTVHG